MVEMTKMMVWIDQDLCTGDGICEEIAPDVFVARDDGLWVVKEEAAHFGTTIVFDDDRTVNRCKTPIAVDQCAAELVDDHGRIRETPHR